MTRSRRARRPAIVDTTSASRTPAATWSRSFSSDTALLAFERAGVDELGLGDADGVDDHEAVLGGGVGGDGLEVVSGR